MHRAGIHVDRCVRTIEDVGTFKRIQRYIAVLLYGMEFKTIPLNKLQYGSEATFPISQSQRMHVEGIF